MIESKIYTQNLCVSNHIISKYTKNVQLQSKMQIHPICWEKLKHIEYMQHFLTGSHISPMFPQDIPRGHQWKISQKKDHSLTQGVPISRVGRVSQEENKFRRGYSWRKVINIGLIYAPDSWSALRAEREYQVMEQTCVPAGLNFQHHGITDAVLEAPKWP